MTKVLGKDNLSSFERNSKNKEYRLIKIHMLNHRKIWSLLPDEKNIERAGCGRREEIKRKYEKS